MSRRVLRGVVVSDKCDKTVIVRVERNVLHPVYRKYIKRHRRYAAHDPLNQYCIGDEVAIVESAPISKTKKWVVEHKVSVVRGHGEKCTGDAGVLGLES